MVDTSIKNIQAQLNQLATDFPDLRRSKQWTEVLQELEQLGQSANGQDLVDQPKQQSMKYASQLQAIQEFNQALVEMARRGRLDQSDLKVTLREITEATAKTLEIERASVWLYDAKRTKIHCIDLYKRQSGYHSEGVELAASDYPAYFRALSEERVIAAHQARSDPRTTELTDIYLIPNEITSMLDAPIWGSGQVIGVICHEHVGPTRQWTSEEQNFVGSVADLISLVMEAQERQRAEVALQKAYEQLELRVQERTAELLQANAALQEQIAERKQTEAALAQERNLFRTLIDNLPDYIFVKDNESRFVLNNTAHLQVLGTTTRDEVMGKTDFDIFPQELAAQYYADEQQVIQTGQPLVNREEITLDPANQTQWLLTTKAPLRDDEGQVIGLVGISRNITERKQVEEALRESEDRFRRLSEATSEGIVIHENGKILDANQAAANLFGYELSELISLTALELAAPESLDLILEKIASGNEQPYEAIFRRKDGSEFLAEISGKTMPYHGRKVRVAAFRDITLHKQAQEALRLSEERYEIAANAGKVGVWDWNSTTDEIYLAPNLKALLGYEDHEIPNQLDEWVKYVHPDDRVAVMEAAQAHLDGLTSVYEIEHRMLHKDGSHRWILVRGTAFRDENGKPYRMTGADTDITEIKLAKEILRENEERYRTIFEESRDMIYITAREGEFLAVNQAGLDLFGYTRDEMIGLDIREVYVNPADWIKFQQEIEQIVSVRDYEVKFRKKDETEIDCLLTATLWQSNDGTIQGYQGIIRDVTERKQAEQEILQRNRELAALNRVATAVTSAFDLKTILRAITREMVQIFNARRCALGLLNPEHTELTIIAAHSSIADDISVEGFVIPVPGNPSAARVIETGRPLVVPNAQIDPLTEPIHDRLRMAQVECLMIVPLLTRGEVIGSIGIDLDQPDRVFTSDEVALAETIAHQISGAIENAHLFEQMQAALAEREQAEKALQQIVARTQALYRISSVLATATDQPRTTFETVLGEYLQLLNLKQGGLMLFNPASEINQIQALYRNGQPVEPALAIPSHEDLVALALIQNPEPLMIEDVSTHPVTKNNQDIRGRVESMLLIPLIVRGRVVGILGADALEKGHRFSPNDIEIGEAIADQLAVWLENGQLLTEAQYRSNLLQTAAEISRAASSILDPDKLIQSSVNLIRNQFGFYYVGLFLVDETKEWAVLRAGTGEAGRLQIEANHRLKIGDTSMIGWCIKNRQARIALDIGQDAVHFKNEYLPDTHSEMALPFISRDEVIGALTVQSVERGAFSAEDITLLQTMADQLANAIENARLFENVAQTQQEAEYRLQETQALQKLSRALAETLQVNEILDIFFEACTEEIGFEYVIFSLVDLYQHRVKAMGGIGVSHSNIKRANHSLDSNDIMADIVRTGCTEIITGWDDRFDKEIFETEGHTDWVRVFTPITIRQENIGLVEAGFNRNVHAAIRDSQIRLLRAFIDQTALALDNAKRYEASQRIAQREALIKEITTKVRASTNLDTILQTTVKEVGEALKSKRAYIHLAPPMKEQAQN